MINMVNNSKTEAAKKILNGDFSMDGFFLQVHEVENGRRVISDDELIKRAEQWLKK